jgi:hypothetical protein
MLVIRDSQMQALREEAVNDFRRRLCVRLRSALPEERMTSEELDRNIEAGIRQARDCRITREVDVARFIEAVCVRLGGFPKQGLPRPALPVLYAYGREGETRVNEFIAWCDRNGR